MINKVENDNDNRYLLKIRGYKKAMLMKYLHITWTMDRMEAILSRDEEVGSTRRLERANTKQQVKRKRKESDSQNNT